MDFPQETYHTGGYWGNQYPPASAFDSGCTQISMQGGDTDDQETSSELDDVRPNYW